MTQNLKKMLLTCVKFVIPRRKQILSNILDLPLPFKPVIALKSGSNPLTSVRLAYDLKPSSTIPFIYIFFLTVRPYLSRSKHYIILSKLRKMRVALNRVSFTCLSMS